MEQRYAYRVRPGSVAMAYVVAPLLGGFGLWALLHDWQVALYGVVDLGEEASRWFFLAFIALSVVILVLGTIAITAGRREIVITPQRIDLPKGEFTPRMVAIAPDQVRDISFTSYNHLHTAVIKYRGGRIRLRSQHFDNLQAFTECVGWIDSLRRDSST